MPPRYAYWTILIDQKPTAFRAREREELLPTLHQLQRKNPDVVMKWFARGRLWDTPEQAQWAHRNMDRPREQRGREWRPGGEHKDPRDRFKKRRPNSRAPGIAQPAKVDERLGPNAPPAPRPTSRPASRPAPRPPYRPAEPREAGAPDPRSPGKGSGPGKSRWSPRSGGKGAPAGRGSRFKNPKRDRR